MQYLPQTYKSNLGEFEFLLSCLSDLWAQLWKQCLFVFYLSDSTFSWPLRQNHSVVGSNDHHYRYLRAKWPGKHASHVMLLTLILFLGDFFVSRPLALIFQSMIFVLMQCDFWTYNSTLVRAFAAYLTDPRARNVKTLHFDLWPGLDLARDHLKLCLSTRAFKRCLVRIAMTLYFRDNLWFWWGWSTHCPPPPSE